MISERDVLMNTITIVANSEEYHEFIRCLRNDPRVGHGFVEAASITPAQQVAYMARHGDRYLVALVNKLPAGYAGSIEGDIRVCVHPDFQGRGVGRALIEAVIARFPDSQARVKVENTASRALFESCGFQQTFVVYTRQATTHASS
jgi:ribosomal-protein-alanine N-acetyltransferase